jgi:hypothetical protein
MCGATPPPAECLRGDNLTFYTGFDPPDRRTRTELQYRLSYRGTITMDIKKNKMRLSTLVSSCSVQEHMAGCCELGNERRVP